MPTSAKQPLPVSVTPPLSHRGCEHGSFVRGDRAIAQNASSVISQCGLSPLQTRECGCPRPHSGERVLPPIPHPRRPHRAPCQTPHSTAPPSLTPNNHHQGWGEGVGPVTSTRRARGPWHLIVTGQTAEGPDHMQGPRRMAKTQDCECARRWEAHPWGRMSGHARWDRASYPGAEAESGGG